MEPNASRTNNIPLHNYVSEYHYDFQNNLRWVEEPDTDVPSEFFYNKKNQLLFSFNGRQLDEEILSGAPFYSYSIYDDLGRVIETGESEVDLSDVSNKGFGGSPNDYTGYFNFLTGQNLSTHYSAMDRKMFIQYQYNFVLDPMLHMHYPHPPQGNHLWNRLNYVIRDADGDETTIYDQTKNYFSYDFHSNTEWVANTVPA